MTIPEDPEEKKKFIADLQKSNPVFKYYMNLALNNYKSKDGTYKSRPQLGVAIKDAFLGKEGDQSPLWNRLTGKAFDPDESVKADALKKSNRLIRG